MSTGCACDPLARPQRASYSLGSYIGANPKSFEPVTDPYVASFLAPQTKGTNLRMAFLRSTKDKAIKKAFDTDAGYGLNFTVASNWKKAAKETIFGKADAEQPGDPSDEVGGETGRDLTEFEDETDAIWRNPLAGSQATPAIPRGKTAGERRQMSFAADGNGMCKAYADMNPRAFFSKHEHASPAGQYLVGADGQPVGVVHTLKTLDPLSDESPFRQGRGLRSRPSSAKSYVSVASRRDDVRSGSQTERGTLRGSASQHQQLGERPFNTRGRPDSAKGGGRPESGRGSRPSSKGGRPASSSRPGTGGHASSATRSHWTGTAGEGGQLEIVGRELEMPAVSFEDDPTVHLPPPTLCPRCHATAPSYCSPMPVLFQPAPLPTDPFTPTYHTSGMV